MKKLKQLSLILFLSVGLFSCEAEKVDEVVKDDTLQGEQIFRYEMDGITRVTNNVTVGAVGGKVVMTAIFNDDLSDYKNQTFTVNIDKLATGTYTTNISTQMTEEVFGFCSAAIKLPNVEWLYSTTNLGLDLNNLGQNAGSLTILSINEKAKYFEGKFSFDLHAPKAQNPNNNIAPIKIANGYFQYVKYN